MKLKYDINNIPHYPTNGKHVEIIWDSNNDLPFDISKGLDGFFYTDKNGKEYEYNEGKTTKNKWIIFIREDYKYDSTLAKLFEIKQGSLRSLLKYAIKIYKQYLKLKIKELTTTLKNLEEYEV